MPEASVLLPIVAHHQGTVELRTRRAADRLAERLLQRQPELVSDPAFRPLIPKSLTSAPAVHLDDLSGFSVGMADEEYLEDRARLRAGRLDLVATCSPPAGEFEAYCTSHLGLCSARWLHVRSPGNPLHLAAGCWLDAAARDALVSALRSGELHYIHPYMGTLATWELALLLRDASRCPVEVVAPHPGLTRCVNDKVWFSGIVAAMLGSGALPWTEHANNLAELASKVREMAARSRFLVLKLPDAAGGQGNVVSDATQFRGRSLTAIRIALRELLGDLDWHRGHSLLVSGLETEILSAPSVQLWIPPREDGRPIVEGVYEQMIEGPEGVFVGTRPARLPAALLEELAHQSQHFALLFQALGYIGRCSFDLLVVGRRLEDCRIKFLECNGRWGGTSIPMTLMNRLFGDWARQPHACRVVHVPGLSRHGFAEILDCFGDDLYDARTGAGNVVLYGPSQPEHTSSISAIALGESWEAVDTWLGEEIPDRLHRLVSG